MGITALGLIAARDLAPADAQAVAGHSHGRFRSGPDRRPDRGRLWLRPHRQLLSCLRCWPWQRCAQVPIWLSQFPANSQLDAAASLSERAAKSGLETPMHFALTEEQAAIQETALTFAKERIAPARGGVGRELPLPRRRHPRDGGARHGHHLCAGGQGGSGLSRMDGALIMEALAYGCPAISGYISIHNMVAWMVAKYASDAQIKAWMPKLASMEWLSSYCLTEPGAGSDAAASRPRRSAPATTTSSTAPSSSSPAPAPPTSISCSRARATTAPAASPPSR